jgi:hypothetical protein
MPRALGEQARQPDSSRLEIASFPTTALFQCGILSGRAAPDGGSPYEAWSAAGVRKFQTNLEVLDDIARG